MDSFPIINRVYEVYKSIVETNHKLNKRWRYSIGEDAERTIINLAEHIIMAKNAPRGLKSVYMIKASALLEVSVMQIRLLLEFGLANETKVFQIQGKLSEIGRMLGGWLKAIHSQ